MRQSFTDLLNGQTRFSRLLVLREAEPIVKHGPAKNRPNDRVYRVRTALCRCDCGSELIVRVTLLKSRKTKSCGCLRLEYYGGSTTHGGRNTPEYSAWHALKARTLNPTDKDFELIGGSGISVCDRWKNSFENFLADMGPRPSPAHVLVRYPDAHGNFEPGNCIWSSPEVRARNRRTSTHIEFRGRTMPLREACDMAGIHPHIVSKRKRLGWPESRWFEPVQAKKQRFKAA